MAGADRIVGRREERDLLVRFAEQGRSAIIFGAPGVGKTRLVREVVDELAHRGHSPGWVAATQSAQDLPLAALSTVLNGELIGSAMQEGAAQVLQAVAEHRRAGRRVLPSIVAVDDVQHLDRTSAALIHQVITSGDATALMTASTGTEPFDAITALWKDGDAERIELQPLSREESDELVTALVGPATPLLLERVWERTRGNPLFVRELIRAAHADGSLVERGGRWRLEGTAVLRGPLVDLIRGRISELPPDVREVLELVALAAPLPLALLEKLAGSVPVAEAEELGYLEVDHEQHRTTARVRLPLYAEAVRALLPAARRRAHCRSLAGAIEATGLQRQDDLLRLLTWKLEGGESPPVALLLRGAWQATEALDMPLGERLARAAVGLVGPVGSVGSVGAVGSVRSVTASAEHHAARLALADSLYRQARHDEALVVLDGAASGNERELTEVVVARAKALWGLSRTREAAGIVAEALKAASDETCRGWLQSFQATLCTALGDPAEALRLAEPILDRSELGARTHLSCLSAVALARAFAGRAEEAKVAALAGMEPALLAAAESRTLLSWIEPSLWVAAWLSGDLRQTHDLAAVYRQSGLKTNDAERTASGSMGTGWASLLAGDLETATSLFEEAASLAPDRDRIGVKVLALIGLGLARAWRNEPTLAEEALVLATGGAHDGTRWFDPLLKVGWAWTHATDGDLRLAVAELRSAATESVSRGLLPYAVHALHGMARLGRPGAVACELAELASRVDGPFAAAAARHAAALASEDCAALEGSGDEFEAIGMLLLAAECFAAASIASSRRDDRTGGERSRMRAEALLRQCPGARPVTLPSLTSAPLLTAREMEVARLAARGCTTRDIAAQLFVSTRTVDSHLAHIYVKLGIDGRHQLPEALHGGLR